MQKIKNSILKTAMSILLIVVFIQKTEAQEQATSFLKDYYSISSFAEYVETSAGTVYKEDLTVNYDITRSINPAYGISVNVYQTSQWNFKTGIVLRPQMLSEKFNFTKEQTGYDFDIAYTADLSGDDTMLSLPLVAEFIISLNKRFKWVIAPSFTFSYYRDFGGSGLTVRRAKMTFIMDDRSNKPIHTSAEISTGFYILFKHFMLQPELRYSKSFNTIKSGNFITENYLTEPHSSKGSYTISGDYWGFSLNIYVKKRGKNKPRKKKKNLK